MWIGNQRPDAGAILVRIFQAHFLAPFGVTVAFTLLARYLKAVTWLGACAGGVLCFLLCWSAGFGAFAALVSVFVVAWASTRFGYQQKQDFGTAEKIGGRNAFQVLANLGVAAASALLYALTIRPVFLLALAASLSEAAADTASSEIGQISGQRPRLVTTWKTVPPGANGGVTFLGTISGLIAAILVTAVCLITGLLRWRNAGITISAAFAGMVVDSFLGAILERRGLLNNDAVNFLGTLTAAVIAIVF